MNGMRHAPSETVINLFKRRFAVDEEGRPVNWKKLGE